MPLNEKDLAQYFIDGFIPKQDEKPKLVRGEAEGDDDDIYVYDEEEGAEEEEKVHYDKDEILILLAAYDSEHFDEYKKVFTDNDIKIIAVSGEDQFLNFSRILPVNGVVVELTNEKQSPEIRNLLSELKKTFPFLQAKFNPMTNSVDFFNKNLEAKTLDDFIDNKCRRFAARTLRSNMRRAISLNVEISPHKEFLHVERSVTLDISANGLFILATSPIWHEAKKCFVCIKEFNSESFIECDIARIVRWGEKPFHNPGIGAQIASIHESLQDDFNMLLEKWRLI